MLNDKTFGEIVVGVVNDVSTYFITFMVGLSVLIFIWGIVKYIYKMKCIDIIHYR